MEARAIIREVTESKVGKATEPVKIKEGLEEASKFLSDLVLKEKKVTLEGIWDIGALFEYFVNRPGTTLYETYGPGPLRAEMSIKDVAEAVASSMFPKLTSALIHSRLMQAYEDELGVEDIPWLVTEVNSTSRIETVAGLQSPDEPDGPLMDGQEYPEGKPVELDVTIPNFKFGRRIRITKETMLFDKTGGEILRSATRFGEAGGRHRRRWIFEAFTDAAITATGQAVNTIFNYKGSTSALYANDHSSVDGQTNDNLTTTALSTTGIRDANTLLFGMKDIHGNDTPYSGEVLAVSSKKAFIAEKLMNSAADPDGTAHDTNPVKSRGMIKRIVSDPVLDSNLNYWYYGKPNRMLRWQWVWRPMTQDMGPNASKDIVQEVVYSYMAGCGAETYRPVVKSEATA